ncbi:hypothetical protein PV325_001919 [Microctonus aethiopoides]|nr:hypothetical protein PV325_001919 [Microctonus aethiopoides]
MGILIQSMCAVDAEQIPAKDIAMKDAKTRAPPMKQKQKNYDVKCAGVLVMSRRNDNDVEEEEEREPEEKEDENEKEEKDEEEEEEEDNEEEEVVEKRIGRKSSRKEHGVGGREDPGHRSASRVS